MNHLRHEAGVACRMGCKRAVWSRSAISWLRVVAPAVLAALVLVHSARPAAAHNTPSAATSDRMPTDFDVDPADRLPRKPGKPAPPSTFPRQNGKPEFTGLWFTGYHEAAQGQPPLVPEYKAVEDKRAAFARAGTPPPDWPSLCVGFGMPSMMTFGTIEIVQRPEGMWITSEFMSERRRIYIDDKPHGALVDRAFEGVSVGHWEGDVLVVHTDKIRQNLRPFPHSDRLVLDERFRMINKDAIEIETTMTDPVALTKPVTGTSYYDRRPPDYEIAEYVCMENFPRGVYLDPKDPNRDGFNNPDSWLPKSAISR